MRYKRGVEDTKRFHSKSVCYDARSTKPTALVNKSLVHTPAIKHQVIIIYKRIKINITSNYF